MQIKETASVHSLLCGRVGRTTSYSDFMFTLCYVVFSSVLLSIPQLAATIRYVLLLWKRAFIKD